MLQFPFALFLLGILSSPFALSYPDVYILNATLPMPITYTSAQYVGGNQIYILGGVTSSSTKLDTVYCFNITDESFTLVGHLPGEVYTGGSAYIPSEDVILYMGGGFRVPDLIRISLNHSEDTISSTIEGNIGNNDLMFTRVAWDSTRRQGYILGKPYYENPGQGFYLYDPAIENVQERLQLISGVWPGDVANVASFYDSVTDKVYFLGGIRWEGSVSLDTIYAWDPTNETLTLLEEHLPYSDTDGNLIWDQETGTAWMFHDSTMWPVLMFFKPTTREVGSIHLEHFMEYSAIRFGMAWVPELRRIYMFGENHEEWWLYATDRIQYIQL
ncbi:hypothetical protein Fcan01_26373 [Folsomia candida]|uniref:Uncharacterized protein n=1 Tax=Folsomia candida TaxID=158441 RepID=A0A226D0M1_FOLCA|nr:hypothetical protein Fcan01_26373 [Folsomia candida]